MKNLAILTNESEYLYRLADFLRTHFEKELYIVTYSKAELLIKATSERTISILIAGSDSADDISLGMQTMANIPERILILSDKKDVKANAPFEYLYKYMSASELAMRICADEKRTYYDFTGEKNQAKIYSFYSPVGNIGTTSLALSYALLKGRTEKVLYINLNSFPAITEELYLDDRKTLSEAIYAHASDPAASDICMYIQKAEGFDTIAPLRSFRELSLIKQETLKDYIYSVIEKTQYSSVIIDYSNAVSDLYGLLGISDKIVVTYREGAINNKKLEMLKYEFDNELPKEVIEKVKYINIPYFGNQRDGYDQIEDTPVGRMARSIDADY